VGRKILFNGEIIKNEIRIDTKSHILNYGTGFFETLLYENRQIYFYKDHINRMKNTQNIFEIDIDYTSIEDKFIYQLIGENNLNKQTLRIKIIYAPIQSETKWDTCVFIQDYKRINKAYSVCVHTEPKDNFLYNFKSLNYMANNYFRNYYKNHSNADEVLFISFKGGILEGSYTNILAVKDNILYYVSTHNNYLKGVMQNQILRNTKAIGLKQSEEITEGFTTIFLKKADEILLTNSLIGAQPIGEIYTKGNKIQIPVNKENWAEKIRSFYSMK